ncbi:MAG: hypothetical protein C0404_01915 [Verrucomicrobia bacterium]|nr:hypothetical protein [Verrucomicrobiota bacterium]
MMGFIRQVLVVARHELADSIRSRRVVVFLILYIAGAMLACNLFITVIHKLERQISSVMLLPESRTPGAVVDTVWKSKIFQDMVVSMAGDRKIAQEFFNVPVIALFYAWLAFIFTPPLVMLSASGRISEEVSTGSARFALTRTSRGSWCLGKFFGQALEALIPILLSAIGAWCVARFRLPTMDGPEAMRMMIIYSWKVWIYSLPYIGLALGISQTTRSQYLAMTLGFTAWIVLAILSAIAAYFVGDGINQVWQLVQLLIPMDHMLGLWRTSVSHSCTAALFLVALAFAYMSAGYAFLSRKDL